MADDNEVRVTITGVASQLRAALAGAKGDLGGLSAAIKAVPDSIKIDVDTASVSAAQMKLFDLATSVKAVPDSIKIDVSDQIAAAVVRLQALRVAVGLVPKDINIVADVDIGVATAKLVLLQAEIASTERQAARASLGGSFAAGAAGAAAGGGGGGSGLLGTALLGGGGVLAGTAALGSVGSFAGFGLEHIVTTIIGLIGFALKGAAGGALLAGGAAGTMAVGGGSDAIVMASTIADTKSLGTALTTLNTATVQYGAGSTQAASAVANLNLQEKLLGDTVGVKAEVQLAKNAQALNALFDKQSGLARVQAVNILQQGVTLGNVYLPLVIAAATKNLAIINTSLKPLFAWLDGPQGKGIFINLEDHFRTELPTAMHAFDQAMELLLRVVSLASNYGGRFIEMLDDLFTRLNSKSNGQLNTEIGKLVADFRDWEGFFKILIEDIDLFFKQGAGTAPAIVEQLTLMLDKLHQWETSTAGAASIHNIFTVHKDEIIALLQAFVPLVSAFGRFYLVVSPPLVLAVTAIAKAFTLLLTAILDLGKASPLLNTVLVLPLAGLAISARLFSATKVWESIKATAVALGLMNAQAAKSGVAGAAGAAGSGGVGMVGLGGKTLAVDNSTGLVEEVGTSLKTLFIRGLAIAGIGTLIAQGVGSQIKGSIGKVVSDVGTGAAVGGGIGMMLGVPWLGAAVGAALGGAVDLFESQGKSAGEKWAAHFAQGLPAKVPQAIVNTAAEAYQKALEIAQQAAAKAGPTTTGGRGPNPHGSMFEQAAQLAAQQSAAAIKAGTDYGNEWIHGMQSVKFPTPLLLTRDMVKELSTVPPGLTGSQDVQWRDAAAQQMIAYAASLASHGQLPKAAVNAMIASLENQFPGLTAFLAKSGMDSAAAIADSLKLTDALSNLKGAVGDMRSQWGDMAISASLTNSNIYSNTSQAMSDLRLLMKSGNAKIRQEAKTEYDQLQSETNTTFKLMVAQIQASMSKMAPLIQAGSSQAATTAENNFSNVATNIYKAMASGVLSTVEGTKLIAEALKAELKAFGTAAPSVAGTPTMPPMAGGFRVAIGKAGGGYIGQPGQRGADSEHIVVGAGEAILNYHQQAPVETALQHTFGMGLGDLFSNVTTPHYMATGGFAAAKRFGTGGYTGPKGSPGIGAGGTGAMGRMVEEANSINAKHFPYLWGGGHNASFTGPYDCSGAVSAVLHAGGLLVSPEVSGQMMSIGQPGGGPVTLYANPDHVYMSLNGRFFGTSGANKGGGAGWFAGAARPGFVVRHFNPGGKGGMMGGVSGTMQIPTPRVGGTGTVPTLVRSALAKAAAAASARLPSAPGPGGASGGGNLDENLANQKVGRSMMLAEGWNATQWPALRDLWAQESGWDAWAVNSTSGAYGIPQSLGHGHPYALGAVSPQIKWGLGYIRGRYGTPDAAEAHEKDVGWYARGGFAGGRRLARFTGGGFARGGVARAAAGKRPGAPKLGGLTVAGMRNLDLVSRDVTRELQEATDLSNRYSGLSGSFTVTEAAPQYTNLDGSLSPAGIAKHVADDQLLIGIDQRLLTIYEKLEPEIAEELKDVIGSTSGDQRKIADDEKQITRNKAKIFALRTASLKLSAPMAPSKAVADAEAQIRQIRTQFAKRIAAVPKGVNATANRATLRRQEASEISALDGVIANERARAAAHRFSVASQKHRLALQANALTGQDTHLSADVTSIRSLLSGGAGGSQNQALATIENAAASFGTVLWGPGGRFSGIDQTDQGVIFTTKTDLQSLGQDISHTVAAGAPDLTTLNQLLTTQLQTVQQALAISQAQFSTLSGFAPAMTGYQSGIGFVPKSGPALLHRGEMVLPDPAGPQSNQAAASQAAQAPIELTVTFANNDVPLTKLIDARMNGKALQIVSDGYGQKARLLAGVR